MESEGASSFVKKDDGMLALTILAIALVIVAIGGYFMWKNRPVTDSSWQANAFTPPPERAAFIDAKKKLDLTVPTNLDELRKLLMRRAMQTIPILLSLQNEGSSIERLYKKGMLTDDMHFKVKELKAFVDQEYQDVQFEANELVDGWGEHIWPQAMQFHTMIQRKTEGKPETKPADDGEEEKKASNEAAKKKAIKDANKLKKATSSSSPVIGSSASSSAAQAPVVSMTKPEPTGPEDEEQRRLEYERQLLAEEEVEKSKQGSGGKKKSATGKSMKK